MNGDVELLKERTEVTNKPIVEINLETENRVRESKKVVEKEEDKKVIPKLDGEIEESDNEETGSDDSDVEIIEISKKRKVPVGYKHTGNDGILKMGLNPIEFELVRVLVISFASLFPSFS